ncbi:MAG: MarR family EPS-associated transcriptional regulator [Nitrosomonadales bacterium]|jgi:EPS-associated MarR family transcriptional regulator|nr:MarR family EPS-associated transcriptional regulator [Nitrosomonadales bacterium]
MGKTKKNIDSNLHYRVLQLVEEKSNITQRDLAQKLGISLGGVNYCLKSLIEIGHLKINNFKKNPNKASYLYHLTPLGASEKAKLAIKYLKCKMAEYKTLKQEIENVKSRINS